MPHLNVNFQDTDGTFGNWAVKIPIDIEDFTELKKAIEESAPTEEVITQIVTDWLKKNLRYSWKRKKGEYDYCVKAHSKYDYTIALTENEEVDK